MQLRQYSIFNVYQSYFFHSCWFVEIIERIYTANVRDRRLHLDISDFVRPL